MVRTVAMLALLTLNGPLKAGVSVDPAQRLECLGEVKKLGSNSELWLLNLCSGSTSIAPVDCYRETASKFSHWIGREKYIVLLCKGAIDLTPVDCVEKIVKLDQTIDAKDLAKICAAESVDTKN
jgi:hypothetical protein